jgi:hypothetical protein
VRQAVGGAASEERKREKEGARETDERDRERDRERSSLHAYHQLSSLACVYHRVPHITQGEE